MTRNDNVNGNSNDDDDQDELPPIISLEREDVVIFNDGLPDPRLGFAETRRNKGKIR